MLHKCANPTCTNAFRRITEGKLYYVETEYFDSPSRASRGGRKRPVRRVEHYWMCDQCSSFLSLAFDQSRGVITMPLPHMDGTKTVRIITAEGRQEDAEASLAVRGK